jgi:hypothetical protein
MSPSEYNGAEFVKLRDKVHELDVDVAVLKQAKLDSDKALAIADEALKHAQQVSNEWRKENIDQRNLFPDKNEVNGRFTVEGTRREALEARVSVIEKVGSSAVGRHSAFDDVWLKLTVVAALLVSVVSFLYHFLTGK